MNEMQEIKEALIEGLANLYIKVSNIEMDYMDKHDKAIKQATAKGEIFTSPVLNYSKQAKDNLQAVIDKYAPSNTVRSDG